MCFSAAANFIVGGAVSVIGLGTLAQVTRPRDWVLAALPLSLGLHQLVEGIVWLGLQGDVSPAIGAAASGIVVVFALVLLPLLIPLGVWLSMRGERDRILLPFVFGGAGLGAWVAGSLAVTPLTAVMNEYSISYEGSVVGAGTTAAYILVTIGPLVGSGRPVLVAFGVLNLIVIAVVLAIEAFGFTSLWCIYAAIVSLVIYTDLRGGSWLDRPRFHLYGDTPVILVHP